MYTNTHVAYSYEYAEYNDCLQLQRRKKERGIVRVCTPADTNESELSNFCEPTIFSQIKSKRKLTIRAMDHKQVKLLIKLFMQVFLSMIIF